VAALRSAVQAYKQEEELAGNIGIKPVKRRRDIAQENTRNEDQPVPASTRMKGVEFPFAVGDRVMIKVTTFVVLCMVTQVYASE
jgi:hypothetical protein